MPVYAILKLECTDSRIIIERYNLEEFSIFKRGAIKSIIRSLAIEMSDKAKKSSTLFEIKEKLTESNEVKIITQKRSDFRIIVIADSEYSSEIGRKLLLHAFNTNNYEELIKEYKTWQDKDTMRQIEEELKKCNVVVAESLSQVLERGESLSDLVEKSENLSSQTKILFKTAKKRNRCC